MRHFSSALFLLSSQLACMSFSLSSTVFIPTAVDFVPYFLKVRRRAGNGIPVRNENEFRSSNFALTTRSAVNLEIELELCLMYFPCKTN